MSERLRRPRTDAGFTLIELLVVIVTMAVVTTVISTTATVILRTAGPTATRAQDSHTLHALNTWLAQDASATPPNNFVIGGALTECSGAVFGSSLVKMTWSEDTGTRTNYVVNYRHVDQGDGVFRIERYTCSGTGSGPYANTRARNVGSDLPALPPLVSPVTDGADTVGVEFRVFTIDGDTILVDGDSRNPGETLPPTTTSTTTTTPTTTTTTIAPVPCTLSSLSASPDPVANSGNGVEPLSSDVIVTITLSGTTCGTITLQYDRGDGDGLQIDTVSGPFPVHTVTLRSTNSERWSEGAHPLQVYDGSTLLTTTAYDLVVT